MTEQSTQILAELIHAKRSCLAQLRELGRQQLENIEAGEMTSLLDLLAIKQRMIGNLQRIERALDPFRDEDPQQRVWKGPAERERCAEEIRDCDALLAEILAQEKCGESALVSRRAAMAARLQTVHAASEARSAYAETVREPRARLDMLQ